MAGVVAVMAGITASTPPRMVVVALQLNLCDSGIAGCFTGRAVARAAALIKAYAPDVVTVNEVCRDDVTTLRAAFPDPSAVRSAFQPVPDRRTGLATRCRDGQEYGIGVLMRSAGTATIHTGVFPAQDPADPEKRVWLCLTADRYAACTTHLSDHDSGVAAAQGAHLLGAVVSSLPQPVLVGGDFNLRRLDGVPAGLVTRTDGGLQYVLATQATVLRAERLDTAGTTDHPGLLVTLSVWR